MDSSRFTSRPYRIPCSDVTSNLISGNMSASKTSFEAHAAIPAITIGFMLSAFAHSPFGSTIVLAGIMLFGITVLFQLVTLPVEINASRRALSAIERGGLLEPAELSGARDVLTAAALTYVAAAVASLLQLLYFVLRYASLGGRER